MTINFINLTGDNNSPRGSPIRRRSSIPRRQSLPRPSAALMIRMPGDVSPNAPGSRRASPHPSPGGSWRDAWLQASPRHRSPTPAAARRSASPRRQSPTLSNSSDKLYFFSKSADKKPGKGTNEQVANPRNYEELASVPHWRKVLSNFHVCPFVFRGMTFSTIEHAFQSAKISIASPARAAEFSVESGTNLGRGDGAAAQKARKMVRLTPEQLAYWDLIKEGVMEQAAVAKYAACPAALAVLRATRGAQLWHSVARSQPVRFRHLERIRAGRM